MFSAWRMMTMEDMIIEEVKQALEQGRPENREELCPVGAGFQSISDIESARACRCFCRLAYNVRRR
jgi:hypothetical protein